MYTLKHAGLLYYTRRYTKKSSLNSLVILRTSIFKTKPLVTTPHEHHLAESPQIEVTKVIAKIKIKAAHLNVSM